MMISRSCFRIRISMSFNASAATCSAPHVHARSHHKAPRRKAGGNQATLGGKKCRNIFTRILRSKVLEGEHCFDLTAPLYTLLPAYLDSWLSAALPPLLSLRARTSLRGAYNPTIISLTIAYETSAIVDLLMDTKVFSPIPKFRIDLSNPNASCPDSNSFEPTTCLSSYFKCFRLNPELILNTNGFSIHHTVQIACRKSNGV